MKKLIKKVVRAILKVLAILVLMIVGAVALASWLHSQPSVSEDPYADCKDQRMKDYTFGKYYLTQSLKDPSSFKQIGYPRKFADSYEITYSATNSYGGRVQETYSIPVTNCKYK